MIQEAATVLTCSVLFIGMGLAGEIQRTAGVSLRILNCPKCLTFWATLAALLISRHPILLSVAVSFITSYLAMWLTLGYDALTILYNRLYEEITEKAGTSYGTESESKSESESDSEPESERCPYRVEADPDDEVPEMPIDIRL